ncbi:sigma 54-interacting transcriptional regulator [Neobacillus sp. PS2-9]|uniref:sigma-54 interaction domain-containing protein n=1 Tax=Neobacillus sp. PS2-9 TaxID=3070676 RepID=UPI0027DEDB49|nr:sigma 54-interacting transcriptional regulator [Neobacillus sp. PS2-9]WML58906.1 sigma 54-interacting transcriptional regulator [Neobacillus sp. PS2-9]
MDEKDLESQLPFGMLLVNFKGEVVYINSCAKEQLRLKEGQWKTQQVQHMLPNSNIIRVIKNGHFDLTTHGGEFPFTLIEFPMKLRELGVILILPKEVQQKIVDFSPKLVDLKQELEAIMNLSGELVTITDANGIVLRVNSTCEKIMGVKESDFVGKSAIHLQQDGVINFSSTNRVIEKVQKVTVQQKTKTGRRLLVHGYPIFNELGKLHKVINISKDITEVSDLKNKLEEANSSLLYYKKEVSKLEGKSKDIIYKSKEMEKVYDLASRIADVDATVFIQGETGVGKEVLARTIHNLSSRQQNPFIKINCGAIPENLIESELFGYAKGTFTGGNKEGKKGLILAANHGTLFLDEIGELPFNLQAKLLQVLQEKQFTPLGDTKPVQVNVRFITATHRNIEEMVQQGDFREDLYYRLFVIPITIPSLSERKQDIPFLMNHFLQQFNEKYHLQKSFDKDIFQLFMDYKWKGNIRELQNTIERLVLTVPMDSIRLDHLPEKIAKQNHLTPISQNGSLKEAVDQYEKQLIINTLEMTSTLKEASEILGIDASTIGRKVKKHNIKIAKLQSAL